jgi:peptide/nickel transport system permease protein
MSTTAAAAPVKPRRYEALGALARSATFDLGVLILLFWVLCALFGHWLVPQDPFASDPLNSLAPPSAEHWFGTDQLGRDVFARVIVGSRDILTIAPLATLLGTAAGTAIGLVVGYFGGWVDAVIGRAIDALLALPLVIVALLALAAVGASNTTVILVIGLTFAPITARTVRAAVLGERHLD